MAIIRPTGVPSLGRTSTVVALTLAGAAPSVATDLTAPNSLNISCFLYAEGGTLATSETEVGSAPRRQCDDAQLQQFGNTTYTAPTLHYGHDPQGGTTDDANKAREMLDEGLIVWLLTRDGLPAKTDELDTGDKVTKHHVRLGKQNFGRTGDDAFGEFSVTQNTVYVEPPEHFVAVVA